MKFIVQLGYSIGLLCVLFLISSVSKADDTNSAKIPFVFRENAGQWGKEILYKGNSSSANVLFTKSGMIVSHSRKTKTIQPGRVDELEFLNWGINFKGANPNPKVLPLARASSYTNYLINRYNGF